MQLVVARHLTHVQREPCGRQFVHVEDQLARSVAVIRVAGTQHLVPADHIGHGLAKCVHVEVAGHRDHGRDVVCR